MLITYPMPFLLPRPIACIAGFQRPVIAIRCLSTLFELRPTLSESKEGDSMKFEPVTPNISDIAMDASPTSFIRLPYRIIYAVATLDTVKLYDTQQTNHIAIISHLHYASLTDIAWSSDGLSLIITSSDGFCSCVTFEKNELGFPLDRNILQTLIEQTYVEPPLSESLRNRSQSKHKVVGTLGIIDSGNENSLIENSVEFSEKISPCTTPMKENTIVPTHTPMSLSASSQPARKRIAPMLISPLTSQTT